MNTLTNDYLQKVKKLEEVCPDCKAENSIFTDVAGGNRLCKACGTVQETNIIDETAEWRNFGSEGSGADMNRTGGPVNMHLENGGLSTTITGTSDQRLISSNNRISSSAKDKNKMKGWAMIKELCREIHVSKTVEQDARDLFNLVEDNEKLKGKKLILKVASVIMIASRKSHLPKNMKDIIYRAEVSKKELSRIYRLIRREVCPKLDANLKPSECITQISSKLNMNGEIEDLCKKIAEHLREREYLTGRSPFTIAGVACYMVTQVQPVGKRSFKEIALAAKLADATIRNAYKKIQESRFDILAKIATKEVIDKCLPRL